MKPPQASISFSIGVPMRASGCFGSATAGTGDGNDTTDDRRAGGEATVNRTCGVCVEYRAAGVYDGLPGRNFTAGAGIDQLLLSALRVLAGQRIQLEAGIVRDQLFDLGEGILLVFLDRNDCGLATPMMSASIFRPPMVSSGRSSSRRWSDVMYGSLCSVDDDRVALCRYRTGS